MRVGLVEADDLHQPIRAWIFERPQQHRLHDAEDRGGRADAERQRDDGDGGEAGPAGEAAKRVAKVLDEHRWL